MAIQATDHQIKQEFHIKTAVILQHVSLHHETNFMETKYTTKLLTKYISTWSNSIKIPLAFEVCNCAFSVKLYLKYLLLAVVIAVDLGNVLRCGDPTVPRLWPAADVHTLGYAVVFCAFEIIQLFSVLLLWSDLCIKFDFPLVINETPNKWRPVLLKWYYVTHWYSCFRQDQRGISGFRREVRSQICALLGYYAVYGDKALIQRSPTECGVFECGLAISVMRRPRPIRLSSHEKLCNEGLWIPKVYMSRYSLTLPRMYWVAL